MKNVKPEAICFFDMDGTLLTKAAEVSEKSLEALKRLRANHIVPIIATGRTTPEIAAKMELTGIDSAIIMNGQAVIYEGKKVYEDILEPELMKRLTEEAKSQGVEACFYNDSKIRATSHNLLTKAHYDFLGEPMPVKDPTFFEKESINMALLLLESGDDYFKDRFPELQFVRNTPFSNDVLRKDGSKAKGIKKFLNVCGYEDVPTYAFGDGNNDLEMFQAVHYGIAMENAVPALKEHAHFVTDSHNDEGIFKGLKHMGLI
jgi:Cof subfamily protein (haloacid dehalogenase superfamily)